MDHADVRRRILLILGALAAPVVAQAVDSGTTGDPEEKGDVQCIPAVDTGECPDGEDVAKQDGFTSCPAQPVTGPGQREGDTCCYVVENTCRAYGCGCAHGRPFLRASGRVLPGTGGPAWLDRTVPAPELGVLSASARLRLATFWGSVGAHEHSSIAAMHRAVLELLALGAPESLVAATQRAALDEARHARHAFTLATHFAGAAVGPGELPLGATLELATDLPALVRRVVAEACVEETLSLAAANRMLRGATDPAVVAVLSRLVRDEARHVELAWKTLAWALAEGGAEARIAAIEAFSAAKVPVPGDVPVARALGAWGAVDDVALCASAEKAFVEVVIPVVRALAA